MIGAGNVATHLSKSLSAYYHVNQVYSRTIENARRLSRQLPNCVAIDSFDDIDPNADIYIVSVHDDAISMVADKLAGKCGDALWMHTSGSVAAKVFEGKAGRYGVLYPLQTFSRDVPVDVSSVPFFIEGNTPESLSEIRGIAQNLSSEVREADSESRRLIHVAAVLACNFTNHLWALAEDVLSEKNIPLSVLFPLMQVTLKKAENLSPHDAQTGPARRGDKQTIQSHLAMLKPDVAEIYKILSQSIMNRYIKLGDE